MKAVDSVLEIIGNTPLVKLKKLHEEGSADVFVKCDHLNPSGSIKDRVALEMIRDAEEQGRLKPGYTIIEASTGNTGTSLSFVGTLLGYKVVIYMPEGMTPERIRLMESFGAEVHELKQEPSGSGGVAGAEVEINTRQTCFEIESSQPKMWWARQFSNPANTRAHFKTGREMLKQLGGELDAFVCSIGTGGTLYGIAKVLREKLPDVKVIGAEPAGGRFPISQGHWKVPGQSDEITGGIIEESLPVVKVDQLVEQAFSFQFHSDLKGGKMDRLIPQPETPPMYHHEASGTQILKGPDCLSRIPNNNRKRG